MRNATRTGLALAIAMALMMPALANALTRMPTGRGLVKPTKQLIVKELRTLVPSIMCVPPYNEKNIKITSRQLKSSAGEHVRSVKWQALHTPAFYGGHKGTCKITATIAPACGIDLKLTNFKIKGQVWPATP